MSNSIDPNALPDATHAHNNGLSRSVVVSERPVVTPSLGDYSQGYNYDVEEEHFNLRKLTAIILRRWKIMAGVFAGIMAVVVLVSLTTPRVYRSSSQVIINSDSSKSNNSLASMMPGGLGQLLAGAAGRSQETEIQILQSEAVRTAALKKMPKELQNGKYTALEVRPQGTTEIVNVGVSSTDPIFAQQYANKLSEAYVAQTKEESSRQYTESANFVSSQLDLLRKKLDKAGTDLMIFKEANGITDLQSETLARVDRIKQLTQSLQTARVERLAGDAQLSRLEASVAGNPKAEIAPGVVGVRPVVQQLEQQITQLQNQLSGLRGEYQPGSPEIRTLEEQIERLQKQLANEPRTQVQTYTRNINPVRAQIDQQIIQLRVQNNANASRILTLQSQLEKARQEMLAMPRREKTLSQLTMTLQGYQTGVASLSDKLQQLRMSQVAPAANAKVLSSASRAEQIKPNVKMNLITGFFAACLLALLGALVAERLDNRIHSDDDVRDATQMPVLAHIPKLKHFETESLVALATSGAETMHTPLLESYRMLRTGLMFTVLDSPLRCIMLTSSQPNEGKSSVAANLATVLAMNGKKVLLIDADLRRPSAQRLFNLSSEKGFSTVAAGMCKLEDAVQATAVEGLSVLTVGPTPPNPPEMLDSRASRQIFKDARALADFVIIDAPPALMMADAQILATEADGIVLVVSWEEAMKNAVAKTTELLARTGVKMLGVVVNKWDDKQSNYSKYYEHYALHSDSSSKK